MAAWCSCSALRAEGTGQGQELPTSCRGRRDVLHATGLQLVTVRRSTGKEELAECGDKVDHCNGQCGTLCGMSRFYIQIKVVSGVSRNRSEFR